MNLMHQNQHLGIGLLPQVLSTTNDVGDYFPMADFREALAVMITGPIAQSETAILTILEAEDDGGTNAAPISGASVTLTGAQGGSASGLAALDVSGFVLTPGFAYIACKIETSDAITAAAVLMRGASRKETAQDCQVVTL
jgi:hypothetical protein